MKRQTISQKDARLMLYCLQELVSIIGPLKSDTLCKIPDGLVNAYLDAKRLAERLDRTEDIACVTSPGFFKNQQAVALP
jgi:hypothetical protein